MESSEKKQPANKYDEQFKRSAVELALNSGRMVKEVAADLGIREFTLYEWKRLHAPPPRRSNNSRPS